MRIKIAESPYLMRELFVEYLRDVVIPSVESNQELPECQGKPTIIFTIIVLATVLMTFSRNWQVKKLF
jgi:hypothetical protein